MVLHIQPVAHVEAGSVYRQRTMVEDVVYE